MTMKKSKTRASIAAVAVVLLTLCLVFMTPVSAEDVVAMIEGVEYDSLTNAINDAQSGAIIYLMSDATIPATTDISKSLTIDGTKVDGGQFSITSEQNRVFTIKESGEEAVTIEVTFRNVTIISSNAVSDIRIIDTKKGNITLNLEHVTLSAPSAADGQYHQILNCGHPSSETSSFSNLRFNLNDVTINLGASSGYAIAVFNKLELNIQDSDISGWAALYLKTWGKTSAEGSVVTITNSELTGTNKNTLPLNGQDDNAFGTIVIEAGGVKLQVMENTVLNAVSNEGCSDQAIFQFNKKTNSGSWYPTTVEDEGVEVTLSKDVTLVLDGTERTRISQLADGSEPITPDEIKSFFTIHNGVISSSGTIGEYLIMDKQTTVLIPVNGYYKVVPKYSISADLSEIAFGEVNVGYEADALPQVTVKVTNDGPTELTINPYSEGTETYWTCFNNNIKVGVGESVDLNLYLMPGLLPGEYSQDVIISANEDSDVKIILPLTVTVNAVDGAYTIVYDANTDADNDIVTETRYLDADEKFSLTPVSFDTESMTGLGFGKAGYFFAGWNATSADGTYYDYDDEHNFQNPSELFGDGNVVHLYALWRQAEIAGIEIVPEYNPETKVTKFAFTDVDVGDIVDAESEDAYLIPDAYPDNSTTIQLNNGVQLTLEFENSDDRDDFSSNPSSLDAPILSALVVYPWADTQLGGLLGGSTSNLVMFEMSKLTSIPTIISVFNPDVENYINDYCDDDAGILTMISAPGADNTNISNVWVTFEIYKHGILTNEDGFSGYHVDSDGNVEPLERNRYFIIEDKGEYWDITLYSENGFSSYAVGYVEPTSSDDTGGAGDDNEDDEIQNGGNTGNNNQGTGNNTPNYNGGGGGKKPTTVTPTVPPTEEPTDDPTDVPGEQVPETPVTPETPEEPSTPAPILAVLAGLGAAVVLRRK